MKRLAIVTTHPIQYYAPIFKLLHERGKVAITVFYTWGEDAMQKFDPGFGKSIEWDIPLLDGYPYEWATNVATDKGSHHREGIINPDLIKQIEAWQPDAVLVYGWAYNSHLKVMRHFYGKVPVYFRGDSTLLNKPEGAKAFFKYLYLTWVYKHVDHAFYVGTNNKAYFKKYGLKEHQLTFAPHAIDNDRFEEKRPEDIKAIRQSLKIPPNSIIVLYAGKFEDVKNLNVLIQAFIKLNRPNVHLILAGNGVDEAGLKRMAAESSVNSKIHFLGFQNQSAMPALYQSADLFCLPSKSETWGLAINEAMACAKAVLVSNQVGCAIDLVRDGHNGKIFKSNDTDDLLSCLQSLTESKEKLHLYGQRSAAMIQSWNFLTVAKAIENQLNNESKRPD